MTVETTAGHGRPSPSTASRSGCRRAPWSSGPPSCSASRSRGSATTRCSTRSAPAASAWSRSRASASRWPRAPPTVHRGHGGPHPAHLRGRRQGAARRDGAAAHQPPARLPDLRQGRRVPAAEPGDVQRPGRDPVRRGQAHLRQADRRSPPRCCSTASAASPARGAPAFSEQIAGDPFIDLIERGAGQQVGIAEGEPFESYFSGNTVQICPVGALTGAAYRFRSRPFDLVSIAERVRALRLRLLAAHRPPARQGAAPAGRRRPGGQRGVELRQGPLGVPLRDPAATGSPPRWSATRTASWSRPPGRRRWRWPRPACGGARRRARGQAGAGVGVLAGGRLTLEDAYAYAKFARVALGTNDIDFRARPHSAEEEQFLAACVAGRGIGVTLRRPGAGAGRAAGRLRARGGVADRLPAAAQGGPPPRPAGVLGRRAAPAAGWPSCPARCSSAARRRGQGAAALAGGARPPAAAATGGRTAWAAASQALARRAR